MLYFEQTVPDHLILPTPVDNLTKHLRAQEAHWFKAHPDFLEMDASTVMALNSATSGAIALQSKPNTENAQFLEDQTAGILCQEETHCGFQLPNQHIDPRHWSMAIRLWPPAGDAKTLLTLNAQDEENYAFLQHSAGQITFKDQQNTFEIAVPSPAPALIIAGVSDGIATLHVPDGDTRSAAVDLTLGETQDLFIACRSNRGGLKKTLGGFALRDVVFWPSLNVLDSKQEATIEALGTPELWEN